MTGKIQSPIAIDFNPQFQRALESHGENAQERLYHRAGGDGEIDPAQLFPGTYGKKGRCPCADGCGRRQRGRPDDPFLLRIQARCDPAAIRKKFRDEKKNIYRKLKTIVIDEISMVRADLLDCVDKFLRLNGPDDKLPFGGVQMIFIGDLYQLPPVVTGQEREIFRSHYATPYFFSAKVFAGLDMEFIELEKIYRQKDDEFIRLLNAIRNRTVTDDDLAFLNRRVDPEFERAARGLLHLPDQHQRTGRPDQ